MNKETTFLKNKMGEDDSKHTVSMLHWIYSPAHCFTEQQPITVEVLLIQNPSGLSAPILDILHPIVQYW